MSSPAVFVLVLAAGRARRFGEPKQLARYRGEAMIRRAMGVAHAAAGERTVLVLGNAWRESLDAAGPLSGFFVLNERHNDGLSSSIAAGIGAVRSAADAVLLTFCDQPRVRSADLAALIDRWDGAPERIVCSAADGYRGPPVLFPKRYFAELSATSGDRGARGLLAKHAENVTSVRCDAAALDVDTQDDLRRLQRSE